MQPSFPDFFGKRQAVRTWNIQIKKATFKIKWLQQLAQADILQEELLDLSDKLNIAEAKIAAFEAYGRVFGFL